MRSLRKFQCHLEKSHNVHAMLIPHYIYIYTYPSEKLMQAMNKPKEEMSPTMLTVIDLNAGIIAGIAAALISQPADTLLSKINKEKGLPGQSVTSRLMALTSQLGVKGLFLGTVPRVCMVSLLTAGQL